MTDSQKEVLIHIQTNVGNSIEQILKLDKELNELNDTMRNTKDELSKVDDAFQDGKMSEADYEKETARLKTELESLNAQVKNINSEHRAYRKELENAVKAYESNDGSIKQMRAELSNMRKEYESLGKVEREGAKGTEMLSKIQQTTEELKRLEEAQGDYRRSVGHYQKALEGVNPTLTAVWHTINGLSNGTMDMNKAVKNAIPLAKNLGKQFLTLLSNPIVLTITAIVMTIKELVEQFRRTDDAMTALQQLFAAFSPIMETFRAVLSVIVKGLTSLISVTTKAVTAVMSLVPAFGEASKSAQEYVKALDQLEETERNYAVQTAKNEIEIARLRNKSSQSDKYTTGERREALREAMELERQNLEMEKQVALEKWRLAVEDAARRHDTSDETKNTIAQLEAAYYNAIANAEAGMRRMYSQMSQLNKQISKESVDAWKKVMGSEVFGSAARKAADANYKKYAETLQKKADDFKKIAESFPDGSEQKAEWEANTAQAQKEATEALENYQIAHKSMVDNLQSIYNDYRKNELEAQRAYEDAVLANMDDTLEKQLQMVENEYKREIEGLRERLRTEEHLTEEARDYINKLIVEKERKLNETLVLAQAQYWATVREDARVTMSEIAKMNQKMMSADPGRVVGTFTASTLEQIRNAAKEFDEQSDKLTKAFSSQYNAMTSVISKALNDNQKALGTFLQTEGTFIDEWAEKPKVISQKVVDMMTAMRDGSQEFANGATKNLETFVSAMDAMRKRIGMTSDEYEELFEILKPFLENVKVYYEALMSYPQKFTTYISNLVYNQVKTDAERIRKAVIDQMDFRGLVQEDVNLIQKEIQMIDDVLMKESKDWKKILSMEPYVTSSINLVEIGLEPDERDIQKIMDRLEERMRHHKLTWFVDFELDDLTLLELEDIAEQYGEEFDSSFSGVLKHLSGSDDINEQMEWLVKNYEDAVTKIAYINEDFQRAFEITGDNAFQNAMIDEATITSQMRRIYDLAKKYGKDYEDWEYDRLEIQGRYVGESDRELKVKADLLALENRRLESEKQGYQNQLDYINNIRETVKEYEAMYNEMNATNSAKISVLQQQLQTLKDEAATFDEGVSPELVAENAKLIADIEEKIERLTSQTAVALNKLASTGFMSVDEMEQAATELEKSVMTANNNIVENTAQQAATTTNIWLNSFTTVAGGLKTITSAFNSMFSEMGETNERWNAFAEATAYMTIGLSMAEGIAEAVAAGSGVPWPANLAAIASGVSAVISAVGSAFATFNQYHSQPKFAQGGYVSGEKGVDKVPAWLSDGEYVIRRQRVKELGVQFLDELNGRKSVPGRRHFASGGVVSSDNMAKTINSKMQMETMKEMLSEVMGEIQPVVSVREISNVQNKVRAKESIARK